MSVAKVCGLRRLEDVETAVKNGAGLLGIILVPGRQRTVDLAEARRISDYVHSLGKGKSEHSYSDVASEPTTIRRNARTLLHMTRQRPRLVGVFAKQPLVQVLELAQELDLDFVQLHGGESDDYCDSIPVPVIRRFTPTGSPAEDVARICDCSHHFMALLDGERGGEGQKIDWSILKSLEAANGAVILAGGLTPANVSNALAQPAVIGVDVSGGVETEGTKDPQKISAFLAVVTESPTDEKS